jgi:hypothetical protein
MFVSRLCRRQATGCGIVQPGLSSRPVTDRQGHRVDSPLATFDPAQRASAGERVSLFRRPCATECWHIKGFVRCFTRPPDNLGTPPSRHLARSNPVAPDECLFYLFMEKPMSNELSQCPMNSPNVQQTPPMSSKLPRSLAATIRREPLRRVPTSLSSTDGSSTRRPASRHRVSSDIYAAFALLLLLYALLIHYTT